MYSLTEPMFCAFLQDPYLRDLESERATQQKIVEAAEKLLQEEGLDKTVKRKRKNNFLDSRKKLLDIEKEIKSYKMQAGRKPTQRSSLTSAGSLSAVRTGQNP